MGLFQKAAISFLFYAAARALLNACTDWGIFSGVVAQEQTLIRMAG